MLILQIIYNGLCEPKSNPKKVKKNQRVLLIDCSLVLDIFLSPFFIPKKYNCHYYFINYVRLSTHTYFVICDFFRADFFLRLI